MKYLYLVLAIVTETIGTSSMQASEQFTKFWPSALVIVSYAISFYFLGLSLKYFPVGIAYAVWSGLGILCIAFIGWAVFGQTLDTPAMLGLGLIITGTVIIQLFSTTSH